MKPVRLSSDAWLKRPTAKLYHESLGALEASLAAVDPGRLVRDAVRLDRGVLKVKSFASSLDDYNRIIVIGGGKASRAMAIEVERLLGGRITEGLVNIPRYQKVAPTGRVRFHPAGHPSPDGSGQAGVKAMLELASDPKSNDLFVCLISGGGSALMPAPVGGLTLSDKRVVTDMLLNSGASIEEVNTVRKHLSEIKGGRLAERLYPATVVSLIISDVARDRLDTVASGPTVPDSTSFTDARAVLERHGLWEKVPARVRESLVDGESGSIKDTPKRGSPVFRRTHNFLIGGNDDARLAASKFLSNRGFRVASFDLGGEARKAGESFAQQILTASKSQGGSGHRFALVAGGETTVAVRGRGKGGRNQEFVLAAAREMAGARLVTVSAVATDGVDGPTDAAGAIADGSTIERSIKLGLDADNALRENDSYTFFKQLGDLLLTGPTGTNVSDLAIGLGDARYGRLPRPSTRRVRPKTT